MRGDDSQVNALGEGGLQERRGPRHAAPRKSLLTKLHMPAGKKAFALAAMPTAVFVGMGLTPKLAMADDSTDIPFAPGPCVTRSDEPSESADPSPSASKTPSPSATESGKPAPDKSDEATEKPTATPSASATDEAKTESAEKSADAPAASATPSPTKSKNPLDPLGLGDALKDLFDGPDKETASPSPSATTATPEPSKSATAEPTDKAADKPVEKATDAAKDTVDKTTDAIRDAADKAGKPVKELGEDVKGLDPKADEDIPDGAKPSFPCPTADPKALAAADLEQGIPRLPNDPWILESSLLTLSGLDYKGIVEVEKGDGTTKKVLKFTSKSVDIKDLHQMTVGPQSGVTGHVKARKGSTSTIRDGEVTMYTEELKGNLFGLIPITFSPETPPPLNVPFAFFTNVKVTQAGQFGGTLTVPGLQNYFTKGTG
ncbi:MULTISPECIES: hypothetical protein [unclassified Streptomyces]|uniref:hypothetical protein n=1 Tax=unclassified Streptomyces TaxID=2593676 RepID=UPI0022520846|nr:MULTISPECIES: hypothetical protein [unclassified Streptomyces]MCX5143000.1 hypothetical protein [Streptomyces sp. NBC_00338]WRZ67439.1 hypothetical protein OG408_27725 [Streptomyces sp. NBC_01257]